MAPVKKIVVDVNTMNVDVHGIKHNKFGIMDQAIDGIEFDPDTNEFRFRDNAFDREWLARNKVTLVVRQ